MLLPSPSKAVGETSRGLLADAPTGPNSEAPSESFARTMARVLENPHTEKPCGRAKPDSRRVKSGKPSAVSEEEQTSIKPEEAKASTDSATAQTTGVLGGVVPMPPPLLNSICGSTCEPAAAAGAKAESTPEPGSPEPAPSICKETASATGAMTPADAKDSGEVPAVGTLPKATAPHLSQPERLEGGAPPQADILQADVPVQTAEKGISQPASASAEDRNLRFEAPDGIAVAKNNVQMKKAAESSSLSPIRDQKLPSAATPSVEKAFSASSASEFRDEGATQTPTPSQVVAAYSQISTESARALPSENGSVPTNVAKAPLEERILHGVLEMKLLGSDSMSVVVRPDSRTEVHLLLAMSNGQVSVTAKMSHGDLPQLQAQWSQLQQSLGEQGIRLKPLEQASERADTKQGGTSRDNASQFSRPDSDESNRRTPVFMEEMTSPHYQFFPKPAGTRRFWESWA